MPETNEKSLIIQNLNYIGLDLNNIPDFLKEYKDVDYKPTKAYEQTDFRVYKYLNLNDIQILLTPTNRLTGIIEKYSKALPLKEYLDDKNEENIFNHASFLKMMEKLNVKEIEKISEEQEELRNKVPFKVKFDTNYLWEIYYSEYTGKYFMMLTTEDLNYSAFFYLLKKQIECRKLNKEETIFVPISYLDYTKRYLKKSEISDLEKYLWLFTNEWPNIYEVFDIQNEMTLHVVGKAKVYDKLKTDYKVVLKTKEEATKFYTLLKALFILKTELPHHYTFETQINAKGEITFEFNNKVINYNSLTKFVKDEYQKKEKQLKDILTEKEKLDIKLQKLKDEELEKNKEYYFREKQVATYLECRKSVFGKIKYFFKNKNGKFTKSRKKNNAEINKIKEENEMEKSIANSIIEQKELYTIEDLIKICIELDRINIRVKDNKLDITALENKIKIVDAKIKNAALFIEKIEEHKKSIFEFWKFSNKDLAPGLTAAPEKDNNIKQTKKIKKAFNYEEDVEDLGIEADKIQRQFLSKEETDALFLISTEASYDINKIRKNEEISDNYLKIIKENTNKERSLFSVNDFDIFGNIKNDSSKTSTLANQRHREAHKELYKILDISNNTTLDEYAERLKKENEIIDLGFAKGKAITDIDIYICDNDKLETSDIKMFYINPEDAINAFNKQEKLNLYKIKIKEGMNLIYNTNILYYDNLNNTLPNGMNVKQTIIFDMNKYKIDLKKQKIFRICSNTEKFNFKEEIICAYEYEARIKENE